jgi:tetratricopeptide (TPR) repeat protein
VSRGLRRLAALALLLAASTGTAPATAADRAAPRPGALPAVQVQDLYYGDVLFYFFQDDYFNAITRLTAAQEKGRLQHHADDAELLLGGLYLSLGQHKEAGRIFAAVLDRPNVPVPVRDRARFFLGKVWYQRGYLDEAARTLAVAGKAGLTPEMDAERRMLLAQALMYQRKYDEAIRALQDWKGPRVWSAYAQFNLGIALVRSGRFDEGVRLLDEVGQLEKTNKELEALRDKANLALGYAYLQANKPELARPALERVRLQGPLSNKALLGVGWADSASREFRNALVPWLELHGRNMLDSAVQESYLAVPYAFAKLGANRQASDYYEAAIREFGAETSRIDESIGAIREGGLLETIVRNEQRGQMGWFWQLASLPDAPESRYLYHLLAQNEFQEGLKNYRMLLFMERNLDQWLQSVDAYDDMLATRKQRFEQRLPQVLANLEGVDVQDLQHRRTELESRVASAEANHDVVALATVREREVWSQVEQLEALAAAGDGSDPEIAAAREKLRLIKGVTYWQMNEGFKARAWSGRKNLREVAGALRETEKRWSLVQEAKNAVPDRNGEFAARIARLRPRIDGARAQVAALKAGQAQYLADIAVRELESQKGRIETYMVQARYALATIYDRAGEAEDAARPVTKPAAAPVDDAAPQGEDAPADEAAPTPPAPGATP